MSFKLNHAAEEIDRKLDLINENKNLLKYPYKLTSAAFPAGLEDVGDGSILTVSTAVSQTEILLTTDVLTAGKKYAISMPITHILGTSTVTNPGFSLEVRTSTKSVSTSNSSATINGSFTILDLTEATEETAIEVYLHSPTSFAKDLVLKPQIEEALILEGGAVVPTDTDWVPYMGKIGNYVDERFNSTNAKIRVLTKALNESIVTLSTTDITEGSAIDTLFYAVYEE